MFSECVPKQTFGILQADQDAARAKHDASLIQQLTEQLATLPTLISQAVSTKLTTVAPPQLQQWLGRSTADSVMPAGAPRQGAQPQEDAQSPVQRSAPVVAIPTPSVPTSLTALDTVWSEWSVGSTDRPSIRKVLQDHGSNFQAKKYQYNKQVWARKRKIICAVIAIKSIERCSSKAALNILKLKHNASDYPNAVNRFAERLPNLRDGIHPEGKHVVRSGRLEPVSPDEAQQYTWYLEEVKQQFRLGQNLTAY